MLRILCILLESVQLFCENTFLLVLYYTVSLYTGTFLWASTGQPSLFDRVNSHKTECQTSSSVHCKHSISLVSIVERMVVE